MHILILTQQQRTEVLECRSSLYLRGGASGAGHGHGLGAAIVAGLDVELDLLTLAQATVAVGLDAGLRQGGRQSGFSTIFERKSKFGWRDAH